MFYKSSNQSVKQRWYAVLQGLAGAFDGLVSIVSLGYIGSNFEMYFAAKKAFSYFKELKKHEAKRT